VVDGRVDDMGDKSHSAADNDRVESWGVAIRRYSNTSDGSE